jgi:hypothetical protein
MNNVPASRFERIALTPVSLALLPGACRCAPSIEVAGAYFPAWLCIGLLVVVGAMLARLAMMASGLAEEMPLQLFVCLAIGLFIAAFAWIAWIGF